MKTGSQYFNYKGFFSIVLMAIVDSEGFFMYADVGGKGGISDGDLTQEVIRKDLCGKFSIQYIQKQEE
uniref:Uncharacterized protein n=1 Tax=Anopheles quadriannulatus TaxID=34691 RepID=A0A182WUS5_ANOQN